jgi:hypothetical protein
VALAGDAPRVEHGTEQYLLDADGQTVFTWRLSVYLSNRLWPAAVAAARVVETGNAQRYMSLSRA